MPKTARASSPRRQASPAKAAPPYAAALAAIERSLSNKPPTDVGTDEEGREFLSRNGQSADVITLPSGLQYARLKTAKPGAISPKLDTPCVCHYSGTLLDGTEFDSSRKRGKPATFAPSAVIQGWTIALQLMGVGDHWRLFIPSELAYGDAGRADETRGQYIAPGQVLVFELELLAVKGPSKPKPVRPKDAEVPPLAPSPAKVARREEPTAPASARASAAERELEEVAAAQQPEAEEEVDQENRGAPSPGASLLFEREPLLTNRRVSLPGELTARAAPKPPHAFRVRDQLGTADSPLEAAQILLSNLSHATLKHVLEDLGLSSVGREPADLVQRAVRALES